MKYRIDVIRELLNCVYDSELPYSKTLKLLDTLEKFYPEDREEFFIAYVNVIKELELMCSNDNTGFGVKLGYGCSTTFDTKIYLTYKGQEFLDKLNDDTIWNRICKNGTTIGLGTLKIVGTSLLQQYLDKL